jgi:hypothetical protein
MAGFKQPDFIERQEAAAKARKAALERFRAKAADPACKWLVQYRPGLVRGQRCGRSQC